jgi:hypothetical protein
MAEFDLIIRGGTLIEGTQSLRFLPRLVMIPGRQPCSPIGAHT